jgi:hypothetical protein
MPDGEVGAHLVIVRPPISLGGSRPVAVDQSEVPEIEHVACTADVTVKKGRPVRRRIDAWWLARNTESSKATRMSI